MNLQIIMLNRLYRDFVDDFRNQLDKLNYDYTVDYKNQDKSVFDIANIKPSQVKQIINKYYAVGCAAKVIQFDIPDFMIRDDNYTWQLEEVE